MSKSGPTVAEMDGLLRPPMERARKKSVIDKLLYTDTDLDDPNRITIDPGNQIELLLKDEKGSHLIGVEKREQWSSFMEYFLSIIGFVIDLGNVWRFPTVCYQNGGGAFLIPFLICLFIIGMPCMYLELAAGQYFQSGNITIWGKMVPYMKGIGYSCVIINILMLSYYNTLQSYALYYLFHSFQSPVPWSLCDREWNTNQCHTRSTVNGSTSFGNNTNDVFLPATEFFTRKLLGAHNSEGFTDLAGLKLDMVLAVFVVFVMTTGCLVGGIKTSGKAVYVTALLPYICLAVLIGQSLFLEGSYNGLKYYLTPNFEKIFELRVWLAAAIQTFFSLGPGFGVLITYASYTKKNTNIKTLTIMCSVVNCATSLLYGVVVFAGLGYMANRLKVDINFFLRDGIGLVYVVYPEIIATFKGAFIFAIVFFIMLITLGMDSAFGGMEGLYTAIVDEYPSLKRHKIITRIVISGLPFLTCLPTVTFAGIYVVQWLDTFAISPSVLLIVCVEVFTVSWLYGLQKFCTNVHEMNGSWPFMSWRVSWKYVCPVALLSIVVLDIIFFEGLRYGDYVFPKWSTKLGYLLNFIALLPIPGFAAYYFIRQRIKQDN